MQEQLEIVEFEQRRTRFLKLKIGLDDLLKASKTAIVDGIGKTYASIKAKFEEE